MNELMNLNKVPFTTYNSQLSVMDMTGRFLGYDLEKRYDGGIFIKPLYDDDKYTKLAFMLSFKGKNPYEIKSHMRPEVLCLTQEDEKIEICFPNCHCLRFYGKCSGFELKMEKEFLGEFNSALFIDKTRIEANVCHMRSVIYTKAGSLSLDAKWAPLRQSSDHIYITVTPDENGIVDFCYEEFVSAWENSGDERCFEECTRDKKTEFENFSKSLPQTNNEKYKDAFEVANYMTWAYIIKNTGYIKNREAIYISKNWMAWLASWDNLFNLLSIYETNPELGMDQIRCLIDYQTKFGAFPDVYNTERVVHVFVKPPVLGAIMNVILESGLSLRDKDAEEIYEPIVKLARFWLDYRDGDNDGICQYNHGNDSGADNCTAFDIAPNVEGADLQAYMTELLYFLSSVAKQIGKTEDAIMWENEAKAYVERFIAHSYDRENRTFVSPVAGTHQIADGDCLLNYIPILISHRLPKEISDNLAQGLMEEGRFYNGFGFATESHKSDKYQDDAYFRGSAWAPLTFFVIIGLMRAGKEKFAMEAMKNFCDMCCKNGFGESYNSKTGEAQRDTAYSWSANVFQFFVKNYLE